MPTPTADYDLPGVSVDIADFGLRVAAPLPGPKLTLFGATTATLGGAVQINEPYLIQSFPSAIAALKNADGSDSELSKAVEKAVEAGAQHVEVVIVAQTSEYATENARWDALKASFVNLKEHPMDVVHSDEAYADVEGLSGTDVDGESRTDYKRLFGDFCYRATKVGNTVRAVVGLTPLLQVAKDESWTVAPTSDAEVLFATPTLAQVNEWVEHIEGNVGTLDDHSTHAAMEGYVYGSIEQSAGVISTSYDGWAREESGSIATDYLGNNVDGMRAVTVFGAVAKQALSSTRTRAATMGYAGQFSENTNGATAYAGFLTTLNAGETPTNKTIRSLSPARSIPVTFASNFLNLRIATMVQRSTGFVVSKGITGAHNASAYTRSDFVNWSAYDTVILAIDVAKNAVEPYIGKYSAAEVINAMQNDLDNALHALVAFGMAKRVTASIVQTRDQQILGNLDIELDIVPTGEIDNIQFRAMLHRE